MKNTSLETKLGMFVALVVVAALVLLEIAGGTDFFKKGYRLHGLFNTAQELKLGDPVKMAGVPIGKVEKIDFEAGRVRVTFKVNQGVEIKTDAKATIRFAGLMGQNFVSINLVKFYKKFIKPLIPNEFLEFCYCCYFEYNLVSFFNKHKS